VYDRAVRSGGAAATLLNFGSFVGSIIDLFFGYCCYMGIVRMIVIDYRLIDSL
jgi:hypothetical protein